MKKFNATFRVIHWFNGGKRESTVIKEIDSIIDRRDISRREPSNV